MTHLLTRLDQELSTCAEPVARAELLAERACYLARIGQFDEANAITHALRRDFGNGKSASVLIWVMLVEGLVLYFDSLDVRAKDRMLRAQALSAAFGLIILEMTATAWLAHIQFNQREFALMAGNLSRCVRHLSSDSAPWKTRFSLVLADALLHADLATLARNWYERARHLAVVQGDQATIGALIYNKAVLSLTNARVAMASGSLRSEALAVAVFEIDSAYNYQKITDQRSLLQLVDACRARALMLQGSVREAATLLALLLEETPKPQNFHSDWLLIYADYAFCLIEIGQQTLALQYFEKANAAGCSLLELDDQIIFLHQYIRTGLKLGIDVDISRWEALKSRAIARFTEEQDDLRLRLKNLLEGIDMAAVDARSK